MNRLLKLLTLLPFIVVGCNKNDEQYNQLSANRYLEHAEKYRQGGQYKAAIIEVQNALKQNQNNETAQLALARIYNELGQGRATVNLLGNRVSSPTREQAIVLAEAYIEQRKFQSALDLLQAHESRLELTNDLDTRMLRVRALIGLGDFKSATAILRELDSDDPNAEIQRARIDWLTGDRDASKRRLDRLLQQHPENVDALLERARIAEQDGDLQKSEELLSKALIDIPQTDTLLPTKRETLQRLMTTLTKLGRSNEALIYAKTLADADPEGNILQDKFKRGVEAYQAGKLDEAETLLAEVYKSSRNDVVGMLLGMIRFSKNDWQGAAEYLTPNVDPETADDAAMAALAATQLQLAQPSKLLEIFNPEKRRKIDNPELKALVGIALLQTGGTIEGEKMLDEALRDSSNKGPIAIAAGRHYLQTKEPKKAIAVLEIAVKANPDATNSRMLIAAQLLDGQGPQAIATAQQLTKSAPGKAVNWWMLGQTHLQLRKLDEAEAALRKALQLQPDFAPAQIDLARIQLIRKQPQQAAELYQTVLKTRPESIAAIKGLVAALAAQEPQIDVIERKLFSTVDNDMARTVMADYCLQRDLYDEAQKLLQAVPDDVGNVYLAKIKQVAALKGAMRALQHNDFETARSRIIDGIKRAPRDPDLLIMLARIEQAAGKLEEARKIAAQLSAQQPKYPPLEDLLGNLAMQEGKPQIAAPHYRNAWSVVPSDEIAAKLYQSLKQDPAAAERFLEEWQKRMPASDKPWLTRGLHAQREGKIEVAISAYHTALQYNPANVDAMNNLAWLYGETGDNRAIPLAEKASQLAPNNPAVLDTYGWLLVKNGQRQKGIEALKQAAVFAPQSAEIQAHLKEAGAAP